MQIYRIWDIKENCVVPKDMVLMTDDSTLCIIEKVHKRRKVPGKPVPVYVTELIKKGSIEIDWNTGFVDSAGTEIFQNDILRIPNKDNPPYKDAINNKQYFEYEVDYDKDTGQWVLMFQLNDTWCNWGALYKHADKGLVVGRSGVRDDKRG